MKRSIQVFPLLFTVLLVLLLVAPGLLCAADRVVLQLPWTHQFQFAGYYMAIDQGYYRDAGLEVIIRDVNQGKDPVSEVLSGQADFGISGSGLLVNRSQGKPVVAISAILQSAPTIFLTLDPSIQSPADLAKKRIMLSPGHTSAPLLALLHQENLDYGYVRLSTSYDYRSLIRGETDVFNAYSSNEPFLLQQLDFDYSVIDPRDYGINFYGDVLFTSASKIDQNVEQVEAFRKASLKGWQYALDNINETIAIIRNQYVSDKTTAALTYEAHELKKIIQPRPDVSIGTMDISRWAQITHHLIAIGAINPKYHIEDAFIYSEVEGVTWRALKPWLGIFVLTVLILLGFLSVLARTNVRLQEIRKQLEGEIKERRRAEEQVGKAKQIMQDALTAVSDGVWTWDVKTGRASLDLQSKEIFGLDKGANPTTSAEIFAYVEPEDMPGIKAKINDHIAGRTDRYDHEFRVNRPNGTVCWVRGRGKVIDFDEEGHPERIVGTNADITARKAAEQEIRDNEKRFQDLIEGVSGIAIQGYDENRKVTFWNKASENLYGYTQDEAMGELLEELIIPDPMRDEVIRMHQAWVVDGIEIPAGEAELVGKGGRVVPIYSSHLMRKTASGCEMFSIDVDLAPLKEAEQQRQELEEQLYQVYKMEALGTLAGGIAHDFNNTLAIILGNVELSLFKTAPGSDVNSHLDQAKTAILRARDLVQQILVYSRQDRHELKTVGLTGIVDESLRLLKATIPSTVSVRTDLAQGKNLTIKADSTQVQQVLINLCNNAVHAMQEKGEIVVSLRPVVLGENDVPHGKDVRPGSFAELSVRDSGSGIETAVLERVFDPFFTTKDVGEGTGMGLAVVQGIVDSHGGIISVESMMGKGTAFRVCFPLSTENEGAVPALDDSLPGGSETILFVDDEQFLVDIGRQMLTQYGYSVQAETDSRRALELFLKAPAKYDLVITDQTMPGLAGVELVAEMKKNRPDIPIILCTGYSGRVSRESSQSLGIDAFCMKPVNMSELLQKARALLDRTQASD